MNHHTMSMQTTDWIDDTWVGGASAICYVNDTWVGGASALCYVNDTWVGGASAICYVNDTWVGGASALCYVNDTWVGGASALCYINALPTSSVCLVNCHWFWRHNCALQRPLHLYTHTHQVICLTHKFMKLTNKLTDRISDNNATHLRTQLDINNDLYFKLLHQDSRHSSAQNFSDWPGLFAWT